MFQNLFEQIHTPFSNFTPYATISDRNAWNSLDSTWRKETIQLGEKYLQFEYPYISATDFLDFSRTGNRVRFEDKSFSKRHALSALVLAECVEDKGRFMDDIINGIFSICEESAWQLPAHNSYIRNSPQLPLPDATQPVMDLFCCETGAVLATASYLLKDRLDTISPFITKRIVAEIQHRIITPYLTQHFWWMGNGKEPMNNWTIWCTQNVLLSVFFTCQDHSIWQQVVAKACMSTDYFLAEYGDDGCCDEGAQYYRHAGLCLFNVIGILNEVTNDAFAPLYQNEKIRNIASYILHVHIEDKYYVNFADCSPVAGRAGSREFLFARCIENENMALFAARDFIAGGLQTLLLPNENNLYYRLQNGFTAHTIRAYVEQHEGETIPYPDMFYPSVGLFMARDNTYYLAVKAGDNDDSHNHNDTGSFTVYKNGQPLLIDVGVESYTKKTFSPKRYEIWTMQSYYHNLPALNGMMQKDGASYKASDVKYQMGDTECFIEMDIAGAYPAECGIASYKRSARLAKGEGIHITDTFCYHDATNTASFSAISSNEKEATAKSAEASTVLSFMTYEKPVLQTESPDSLQIAIGSLSTMYVTGGQLQDIEEIPITDARLQTAWEHSIYRILVKAVDSSVFIDIL